MAIIAEKLSHRRRWLVTGVAGFIGSNLLETLLNHDQVVVGLDNFSTGKRENLLDVERIVGRDRYQDNFTLIEGDLADQASCERACADVDVILHQGALGSVPRSIADPLRSNDSNVTGFLQLANAARHAGVKRFVYASSSSVYGDAKDNEKVEDSLGNLLSPYAVTKRTNELYANVFAQLFDMAFLGLRYFNVFGPRQDPNGAYAAVIPRWVGTLLRGESCTVYGDGLTSRDFCYIQNVIQANILAGTVSSDETLTGSYNIAVGETTNLCELYNGIQDNLAALIPSYLKRELKHEEFRQGDIRRSLADISKARSVLGYSPTHTLREGLTETVRWYVENLRS